MESQLVLLCNRRSIKGGDFPTPDQNHQVWGKTWGSACLPCCLGDSGIRWSLEPTSRETNCVADVMIRWMWEAPPNWMCGCSVCGSTCHSDGSLETAGILCFPSALSFCLASTWWKKITGNKFSEVPAEWALGLGTEEEYIYLDSLRPDLSVRGGFEEMLPVELPSIRQPMEISFSSEPTPHLDWTPTGVTARLFFFFIILQLTHLLNMAHLCWKIFCLTEIEVVLWLKYCCCCCC